LALVTLTSDIGSPDYLVGAIKAQLLQTNPEFRLIDISHTIPPFNYPQAAYVCRSAIRQFPDFSYHIILVNLFDKKPEQLLLAFHQNQYFLCADNGLLTMILEDNPEVIIGLPLDKAAVKNWSGANPSRESGYPMCPTRKKDTCGRWWKTTVLKGRLSSLTVLKM
jgi:S-adenosyl-L-methionine hydrolase (adenosine-forming)